MIQRKNTVKSAQSVTSLRVVTSSRASKVKRRLVNAAMKSPEVLMVQFDNSVAGYNEEQVEEQRDEYGINAITKTKKDRWYKNLFHAFINPFTIVLLAIGVISYFVDREDGVITGSIVLIMVALSGLLKFIQEMKNSNAAERLTEMVETTVHVQRQVEVEEENESDNSAAKDKEHVVSKKIEIPLDELVVGDILYLAAGDMIPADVRILKAKDLFISQSSLTGESEPVEKFAAAGKNKADPLEMNNLAFMGTNVVSGSATALVLAVGDDTVFGGIAKQLQVKKQPTSFEKGINSVSWVLIRFMLIMVPVIFLLNGWMKSGSDPQSWEHAFMFAISVAVGLTPEMLPVIVSANLAKGAVFMSRKKVIVKHLNSIQNFGAMDVLCTDKTGTLTQDKVILEYHLDIHGKEDPSVLRTAFLNSYYQTGLKSLMDISVIEKATAAGFLEYCKKTVKVDEIPFDFQRRRMSVVVDQNGDGKPEMITKGAIEEMLQICSSAEYKGKVVRITDELKREILEVCHRYNDDGMRVVGVAVKNYEKTKTFGVEDEKEMILVGYLAFLDPPKETAKAAIAALNEHGVTVKVLTGDNDAVAKCVCRQVGIVVGHVLLGSDVEDMTDEQLRVSVEKTNVFAKLSPTQKARIVTALRANGHTVGFMGDGINDAAAMKAADVGISVDTAVDIAKESANIILLEKDLMVLEQGIIEGRKIYGNIVKYIKMTASSNFGNMFSMLVASAFLPFLPMLPIQILMLNLIYDTSCASMPWDHVDKEFLLKPRKWEAKSITKFMLWMGPTSSVFDISTFGLMFWVVGPYMMGGQYKALDAAGQAQFATIFQTGWFIESLMSQTLVVHLLRSPKFPFIKSRASWQVTLFTFVGVAVGIALPFIPFIAESLGMTPLGWYFFIFVAATILAYFLLVTIIKSLFVRRYKELL